MSEPISLNYGLYKDSMIALKDRVASLKGKVKTSASFDKTNITPFVNDLENTINALELMAEYKGLFEKDIVQFERNGDILREKDEDLSRRHHDINAGHQPIM